MASDRQAGEPSSPSPLGVERSQWVEGAPGRRRKMVSTTRAAGMEPYHGTQVAYDSILFIFFFSFWCPWASNIFKCGSNVLNCSLLLSGDEQKTHE